tara:strand:+ start:1 stop:1158 length:1158 start_codon:yes stop_codon:yes gene_type:complete
MKFIISLARILTINIIILYSLLYSVEIFLQFKKGKLYNDTKYTFQKKISKKLNKDVVLAFAPYKLINKNSKIIPLSGIPNKTTILCDIGEKFITYKADRLGFNNKEIAIVNDVIIVGDSYVHGNCLDQKYNLVNQMNHSRVKSVGLGMMGNGPLIEYATFREYEFLFKYKYLVWIFVPENDYYDLTNEQKDIILKKYLVNQYYKQNLVENQNLTSLEIYKYLNSKKDRPIREFLRKYHLDIAIIRNSINKFNKKFITKEEAKIESNFFDKNNILLINKILLKTNDLLKKNNKKLIVVFNANNPELMFPKNIANKKKNKLIELSTNKIKKKLIENNIIYVDFNTYIKKKYNYGNVGIIFKKTKHRWNHYTKEGNAILAKLIFTKIH